MADLEHLLLDPTYLEQLYREYQRDPSAVDPQWRHFFAEFDRSDREQHPSAAPPMATPSGRIPENFPQESSAPGIQIYSLVQTYREFGHLIANIDPLGRSERAHDFLDLQQFGFTKEDMDAAVECKGFRGLEHGTVRDFLKVLRETYCGPIGIEYMDVVDKPQRDWLQAHMEPTRNRPRFPPERRRAIARNLIAADTFEESLHTMYTGAKRFSLEGGTTLITLLQGLVEEAARSGVKQMVLGMAHRGRLNVLANVMRKPVRYILAEFEGRPLSSELQGYGDVKYHLGYSSDYQHENGNSVHLSMAFNPSHLETVNPVVAGIVRAKQALHGDSARKQGIPVLIHGDAAFAGQGVVAETLLLGGLDGYNVGGTIHVIVNNQIGFTTDPSESRSTRYASDIAMSSRAPVIHVNADHPEAVAFVAQLAMAYRQRFGSDIVIDLVCFRRHGHNEMDDASFTQPVMARLIAQHPAVSKLYAERLVKGGFATPEQVTSMVQEAKDHMASEREKARKMEMQVTQRLGGVWKGLRPAGANWGASTGVARRRLERIAQAIIAVPEGFQWHQRLERMMKKRADSVLDDQVLDWGTGEALAFGSLLLEGTRVRLSGQDSARGTFGHRHAVYRDFQTGTKYTPLCHLDKDQGVFEVVNSPLSEEAVLGFEYGYSSADPWSLVLWEAQFGDFVNGAQVIIDQLIASAEYKWGRMSGIVLLLPHGYEGQGPEHSSARLERFLELCAERNMQVCNLTTPAQYFHVLRRQMHRDFRKPLIIMSPKSLLRHPAATSAVADFAEGRFQTVIDDTCAPDPREVSRALLCSGKIYYALRDACAERERSDIAIIRIEQLYPYPLEQVRGFLTGYPKLRRATWVQEEPRNMGAWRNLRHQFLASCPDGVSLDYVGRDSRAVPATGVFSIHKREEAEIIEAAFDDEKQDHAIKRHAGDESDAA